MRFKSCAFHNDDKRCLPLMMRMSIMIMMIIQLTCDDENVCDGGNDDDVNDDYTRMLIIMLRRYIMNMFYHKRCLPLIMRILL